MLPPPLLLLLFNGFAASISSLFQRHVKPFASIVSIISQKVILAAWQQQVMYAAGELQVMYAAQQ